VHNSEKILTKYLKDIRFLVYNSEVFKFILVKELKYIQTQRKILLGESIMGNDNREQGVFQLSGFTLVELLVVISIIALLMAILMPALQKVKKQAQGIICRSNLKNYGVAMRVYLDDSAGLFPYVNTWLFKDGQMGCQWHDARRNLNLDPSLAGPLWPYLKNKDIHLCKIFSVVAKQKGNCAGRCNKAYPIEPQYGYVMNCYLNGDMSYVVPTQYQSAVQNAKKESGVKNPASVYLFSEENSWAISGLSSDFFNDNSLHAVPAPNIDDCLATFHDAPGGNLDNGYANAVFVDGHVGKVSARPLGNTFILSWPGGSPVPKW
jgi:prepilin-type N-terminal cleavage/methylation domain-containing protein/prepilin-type processing-associated H-X9-DG protein